MEPLNLRLSKEIEATLPFLEDPTLEMAVNFKESSTHPIHRWFRYREGFSPSILQTVSGASRLYDPFSGCGTALIEAKRQGIEGIGTEINPLAVFVARVKTKSYSTKSQREFRLLAKEILTKNEHNLWPVPNMPLLPRLFQKEALDELQRIRNCIEQSGSHRVKELLFLCWLNILEKCSNVFKEGNGLKYRNKRRRPHKYETIPDNVWVPKYFGPSILEFVRNAWTEQCGIVSNDLENLPKGKTRSKIIEMSCLSRNVVTKVGSCDAAVFSPPYANRFDYFEAFKLELWMGGFVTSSEQVQELRQRSMRNNLTVADGDFAYWEPLESFLELMEGDSSSVRMGIKNTLRGYFNDVRSLAQHLHQILRSQGKMVCVVGNSAYAGVVVPTDILCAILFAEQGFHITGIKVARHLTVSSQQRAKVPPELLRVMRESVIECVKQ
jgi:hypothetical protein